MTKDEPLTDELSFGLRTHLCLVVAATLLLLFLGSSVSACDDTQVTTTQSTSRGAATILSSPSPTEASLTSGATVIEATSATPTVSSLGHPDTPAGRMLHDGSMIALVVDEGSSNDTGSSIHVLSKDGLAVLSRAGSNDYRPLWSPDGSNLAYIHNRSRLWVATAQGGIDATRGLTCELVSNPAWSPDSHSLVFEAGVHWAGFEHLETSLYLTELDAGEPIELVYSARDPSRPAFSPDGLSIAYISRSEILNVIPVAGGPNKYLAEAKEMREFAWSPDGSTIAYASSDGRESTVGIANVAEDGSRILVRGDFETIPWLTFSPDGSYVLFWVANMLNPAPPSQWSTSAARWSRPLMPAREGSCGFLTAAQYWFGTTLCFTGATWATGSFMLYSKGTGSTTAARLGHPMALELPSTDLCTKVNLQASLFVTQMVPT